MGSNQESDHSSSPNRHNQCRRMTSPACLLGVDLGFLGRLVGKHKSSGSSDEPTSHSTNASISPQAKTFTVAHQSDELIQESKENSPPKFVPGRRRVSLASTNSLPVVISHTTKLEKNRGCQQRISQASCSSGYSTASTTGLESGGFRSRSSTFGSTGLHLPSTPITRELRRDGRVHFASSLPTSNVHIHTMSHCKVEENCEESEDDDTLYTEGNTQAYLLSLVAPTKRIVIRPKEQSPQQPYISFSP
ncbi:hypothetical protein DdX_12345 [Ditylenchus destructor]|uniref:Uncharacterized protein n=1 Tax=Ditylenchus destructor TaxID=166010 RepID=A0AAD4MWF9_9BILA|nr:hypothetical protein DdX_12345 [Ditylenchus destructor]